MQYINYSARVQVRESYDIIVSGGGVAGAAAALAAARAGKKVMLIEKTTLLGGLATIGLINYFVPMCNGNGTKIIKGMAEEFFRLSIKNGYHTIPEVWQDGKTPAEPLTSPRYTTRYSAQIFALELTKLLDDAGVTLRFDSIVSDAIMENGVCKGIIVESKSGKEYFPAKVFIDTTGDADLLARADIPTIQGKNYLTYIGYTVSFDTCRKALETGKIRDIYGHCTGGRASLYGRNHPEGVPFFTGTSGDDVTNYLLINQKMMLEELSHDVPGDRDCVTLPTMPQFRTTRCIRGEYVLTTDDVYHHFNDSVGAICDFDNRHKLYEIPYRTLCNGKAANILTAGRSASATGYAWDVLRVIPPAIISGEAAGFAASIMIDENKTAVDCNIDKLQSVLADNDVMIHFDDALIPDEELLKQKTAAQTEIHF